MNPFLSPVIARWKRQPDSVFGLFYDADQDGWNCIDLDAFMRRAMQFAALYREAGGGDRILLIVHHDLDAHAAFIGAMLIGAVPSFLPYPNAKQDHDLYWQQHRLVFSLCSPALIVVYDELYGAVSDCATGSGASVVALSRVEALEPIAPILLPGADDIALLQHSSGTTGLKKGVALSYRSIAEQLESYSTALQLDSVQRPRIASWLPLYHDMGLISSFLLPLFRGIPLVSIDPFEWIMRPMLFLDAIEQHQCTHAWLPNFAFLHMARFARGGGSWDLSSLRGLISCSEPCKAEAFDTFLAHFASSGVRPEMLQTCYAMAETVFAVSQSPAGQPVRRLAIDPACIAELGEVRIPTSAAAVELLSNGAPIPRCEVKILRQEGFVAERMIGEICVRSSFMFTGYHENETATRLAFIDYWYRTGDLGFLDCGEVFVIGRTKDTIIVNGKNIFAHDVEAVVSRVPNVKAGRAVAFGRYDEKLGSEQLVVVAERQRAAAASSETIREINRAVMAEVGVACADIRLVEAGWLIKTTSGKISRADNARKYSANFREGTHRSAGLDNIRSGSRTAN